MELAPAAGAPERMNVKNTFIDYPATPAGGSMPQPLASAPAQYMGRMQASLAAAAGTDEVLVQSAGPARRTHLRPKPDPLKYVSGESKVSVQATPTAGTYVTQTPAQSTVHRVYMAGSVPPTPAAMTQWDAMATPTGTPMAYHAMTAPRQTLSLVSMIQTPTVESKNELLESAYHQVYRMPAATAAPAVMHTAPPQYVATAMSGVHAMPAAPSAAPAVYHTAPAVYHSAAPEGPLSPPPQHSAPQVLTYQAVQHGPPMGAPGSTDAASRTVRQVQGSPLASIKLGLVSATAPVPTGPPCMGSTAVVPQPYVMAQLPVTAQLSPATLGSSSTTPTRMMYAAPHYQAPMLAAPAQGHFRPPPPAAPAPMFTPKGVMPSTPMGGPPAMLPATPAGMAAPTMLPAVAVAPAPMAPPVAPAGGSPSSGGMAEADLKVLLDMALASGNQAAIDALRRQAEASGMSAEQFNAGLPQPA